MALVSYFRLYLVIFIGLTVEPWVSGALCNPNDERVNDVPVVITNRMYKPKHMTNVDFLFPNGTYSEKQRNNVRKFYGAHKKMERINDSLGAEVLYDVKYCGKSRKESLTSTSFYGIVAPKDDEKELNRVFKHVEEKGKKRVLFAMHGISTIPFDQIRECDNFNERTDTEYFAVPILWKNEKSVMKFCEDKDKNAPKIAEELSDLWPIIELIKKRNAMPMSLMAHSLGNHVLSIFAESRSYDAYMNKETMFKDIYMVAPAVRWNMFNSDNNDPIETYTTSLTPQTSTGTDKYNKGNGISLLADKVHVLWNTEDNAGAAYAWTRFLGWLHIGSCNRHKGLLNNGYNAEIRIHRDLKDKVDFYQIPNGKNVDSFLHHSYQWMEEATSYFIGNYTN